MEYFVLSCTRTAVLSMFAVAICADKPVASDINHKAIAICPYHTTKNQQPTNVHALTPKKPEHGSKPQSATVSSYSLTSILFIACFSTTLICRTNYTLGEFMPLWSEPNQPADV